MSLPGGRASAVGRPAGIRGQFSERGRAAVAGYRQNGGVGSQDSGALWRGASVVLVWLAAVAAGVTAGILVPRGEAVGWLAVALAGCTVLALVLQLVVGRTEGYIARTAASVTGALVVLAVASGILALV